MDLERTRANAAPKCANCGWWQPQSRSGASAAACDRHGITTLDLSVCSAWRDGEPEQQVLKGDEDDGPA